MLNITSISKIVEPIVSHILNQSNNYEKEYVHIIYESTIITYLVAIGYTPSMAIKIFEDYQSLNGDDYIN